MKKLLFGLIAVLGCGSAASAAPISITALGTTYTQDFNGLTSANSTSGTLPNGLVFSEAGTNADALYGYSTNAQGGTFGAYSLGTTAADRAFGSFIRDGSTVSVGLQYTNTTGKAINSLSMSYRGELYRSGTSTEYDRLAFGYSTTATSLESDESPSFIEDSRGDITSPLLSSGSTATIAGTPTNPINITLNGLNIANGQSFFIRFRDVNVSGIDDALAVDDFSITATATPEPATWAMMFVGVGALAMMQWKRKRSSDSVA